MKKIITALFVMCSYVYAQPCGTLTIDKNMVSYKDKASVAQISIVESASAFAVELQAQSASLSQQASVRLASKQYSTIDVTFYQKENPESMSSIGLVAYASDSQNYLYVFNNDEAGTILRLTVEKATTEGGSATPRITSQCYQLNVQQEEIYPEGFAQIDFAYVDATVSASACDTDFCELRINSGQVSIADNQRGNAAGNEEPSFIGHVRRAFLAKTQKEKRTFLVRADRSFRKYVIDKIFIEWSPILELPKLFKQARGNSDSAKRSLRKALRIVNSLKA